MSEEIKEKFFQPYEWGYSVPYEEMKMLIHSEYYKLLKQNRYADAQHWKMKFKRYFV